MAQGVNEVLGDENTVKMVHPKQQQQNVRKSVGVMGSRRIFAPAFKLKVLDSYRNDIDCRGNQRATARKYGIHRRQIQKWLQCEDNLRSSCTETGNSSVAPTTTISSASAPKADSIMTETTGPVVTPVTPALNLSLARLHGDELATQQGSPPLLPRPPHEGSPLSPQYCPRTTTTGPVLPIHVTSGFPEYSPGHEQHRLRRELEQRPQGPDVHNYPESRVDQEHKYYVLSTEGTRESDGSSMYGGRNDVKIYQTLTTYHSSRQDHRYGGSDVDKSIHSSPEHQDQRERVYGDAHSSVEGKTYGLLLAPSMIKTERASPDSVATPGPYESTCSPVAPRGLLSPLSHLPTGNVSGGDGGNDTSNPTSVHFESPRVSVSPCTRVHVREHAHSSSTPDSEKPIPCLHQQEREPGETLKYGEERGRENNSGEREEFYRAMIKEEVHLEEDTIAEEQEVVASSCIDYEKQLAGAPLGDSRSVSPTQDREIIYSTPSSPRGPSSSGRSSGSCSDSEMDPLDCSCRHSSGEFSRRRSFSLRFKLDVLDAFHGNGRVGGNQRATARKFGINRRQVQKWLGQETELRGEIALRGNSRQRLGPVQDATSGESPVDLRTTNFVPVVSHDRIDTEYERLPQASNGAEVVPPTSHHYYQRPVTTDVSAEIDPTRICTLPYCGTTTTLTTSSYQDVNIRGPPYTESQGSLYSYSPRDYSEPSSLPENSESISYPRKREHCAYPCCNMSSPPPKRFCMETDEAPSTNAGQKTSPQETPLCLVKPKKVCEGSPSSLEPVPSAESTPPSSTAPATPCKKDAILFKPYLDNPVSKPSKEHVIQRELSPVSNQSIITHNNNNCQSIRNLNEDNRRHDYAVELSLRVPVSWRAPPIPYTDFPHVRSAFVRYPTCSHYT